MKRTLLSTKLLIPKPRKGCIVREGLFQQLDSLTDKRLTVIKGAPGSGKTTLLTSYIEQNALPVRWFTLDRECSHLALFWDYVVEALSGLLDEAAGDVTAFLETSGGQNINQTLNVLINAVKNTEDIVLALDDFHLLDNAELLRSFEYFLANIPPCFHVVLLTREKPAIYLAGYELQGDLLYIDEQDLYLTDEEGIGFLKNTLSLSMPDTAMLELVRRAGGWIGGLQLLVASKRTKPAVKAARPLADSVLLHDYITSEIFSDLTPDEQDFLVFTSVPAYFNQTVCECLFPGMDCESVLSGLLEKNLMIQCVDEENGRYQYHNLLRKYLTGQFKKLDQELQTQIYQKLADIFHGLSDSDESLRHLLLLKDYDLAMDRILQLPVGNAYYAYLEKVPVEQAVENFDFAIQKFFYHYYLYDFETCTALYSRAISKSPQDNRYEAFKGAPILYAGEAFLLNGSEIFTEEIGQADFHPLTKAFLHTKNAAFLFYQDQYTAALEAVNSSIEIEKHNHGTYIHYFNLTLKMQICEEMGLLNKALVIEKQVRRLFGKNAALENLHIPTLSLTLSGIFMKQMRLYEANETLQVCEADIDKYGVRLQYNYNLIEYLFLTGETEKAADLLFELMETEAYKDMLMLAPLLKHLYCAGEMPSPMQDAFVLAYENKPREARPMHSQLLYAKIQNARGERQRALLEIDNVLRSARKQESHLKIVEAALQRLAVMISYSHDLRRLADLYKEALYYACDNRILIPFLLEADTVAVIHQQYGDKVLPELSQQQKTFHNDILKMCITKENCILSVREQEIMCAIAEGLSNNDIARQLFISVPTVKTHISNIFSKLKVNNRLAALEKARQMGLV